MKKILISILFLAMATLLSAQDKNEPVRPALLIIDIQNQFLPMAEEREKTMAFMYINAYIEMFREQGYPIVRIYHSDEEWGPAEGTPEFEFPEEIAVSPDDPKVIKTYSNAFTGTGLAELLQEHGSNTLFLCGLSSVGCVLATWFGAKDHDLTAFLLKEAMMSHNPAYTDQVEDIFNALGYEAVKVMVEGVGR